MYTLKQLEQWIGVDRARVLLANPEWSASNPQAPPPNVRAKARVFFAWENQGMTETEKHYAEHLEALRAKGEIVRWDFEPESFKIALDRCRYTPDFRVVLPDGHIEFHEVKGTKKNGKPHYWDDAMVKIKATARIHGIYEFVMVWPSNGEWMKKRIKG